MNDKIIRVAVLAEEPLGWPSGKHFFPAILNNYTWKKNDTIYKFSTENIYDKDILQGKLNISNYDVLLVPGGGVGDGEALMKSFNFLPSVRKWKKNVSTFIKDGGGYVGICGGATFFTSFDRKTGKKHFSFFEKHYNESSIGISCVKHYFKDVTFRFVLPFQRNPEEIGAIAYVFSFAPGETKDKKYIHTAGVPVDFQVSKDNPIFSDYKKDTVRIRWWGGPALVIPEKLDRGVNILARYPKKEFSLEPSTSIYAWRYTGGFFGLIKSFFKSLSFVKKNKESLRKALMYIYYFAKPWKRSDKIIDLDFADRPSIVSEIYPNKNKGRIILCTAHPEFMIWWDAHIEEIEETKDACIATGLHRWKNIRPISKKPEEDITHTWWIVRRIVAWTGKISDKDLPPIEKSVLNDEIKEIIKENIFWDGTLKNQIINI